MKNDLLRHLVATIDYRFQKSTKKYGNEYGKSTLGKGSRSPLEIIQHMTSVLTFAIHKIENTNREKFSFTNDMETEIARLKQVISLLDTALSNSELDLSLSKRLIQGPLSDVLTHIGQLAMLSRIFSTPVDGENFFIADVGQDE